MWVVLRVMAKLVIRVGGLYHVDVQQGSISAVLLWSVDVGTQGTFLAYGVTCIIVFVGYFALNFFYVSKQPLPPMPEGAGPGQTESVYLAPHGVPGGIPRSPSKAKGTSTSYSCTLVSCIQYRIRL